MKLNLEVELSPAGTSRAGKEKLEGQVELPDGGKAYVTVYRAAPVTAPVAAKPPSIRKGRVVQGEAGNLASLITPELLAMLAAKLQGAAVAPTLEKGPTRTEIPVQKPPVAK